MEETFILTRLRKVFTVEEIVDDLVLAPVSKYVVLGNIIDYNSPAGQFILIIIIFILCVKVVIKSRLFM